MAENSKIKQILVGSTTYDIQDSTAARSGSSTDTAAPGTSTAGTHTHSISVSYADATLGTAAVPTVSYDSTNRGLVFGSNTINAVVTSGTTGTTTLTATYAGGHSHTVNSHSHTQN